MHITFDPTNPAECAKVREMLGSPGVPSPAPAPAPAAYAPPPAPASAPAPAAYAPPPASAPAPAPAPAPNHGPAPSGLTTANVTQAIQAYAQVHKPTAARAILTQLGYTKAQEVPPHDMQRVIDAFKV